MESKLFINYLENGSLEGLKSISKSDLHNHASNGGNVEYIKKLANIEIESPPPTFMSIIEMEKWAHANIKKYCNKYTRYEAAFAQAKDDGITILAMTIFRDEMDDFGTCEEFIEIYKKLKDKYAPDILFLPEISYNGESEPSLIDFEYSLIDEVLSYDYFKSIELCYGGFKNEKRNFKNYKKIFRKAKEAGLKLKAHAGEFDSADNVMRAVEELELDEIHHGIAAASSPQIMKWLAKNKIRLNICPTSNVMLRRVESYEKHPIRVLYDYGIPISINSDDMLIFNQSVSQEYLNLYKRRLMTAEELDEIRMTGLNLFIL